MPRVVLNPKSLGKLRTLDGQDKTIYFDASEAAPAGFGLRVRANGSRGFVVMYRTKTGTKRLMRLGGIGDFTLAEAREAARRALARAAAGEDPATDRHSDETAERLEDLVLAYINHGKTRRGQPRAEKTTGDYRRAWADNIKRSQLGRMKPEEVTARHVERFLAVKAKTAPVMADRLHALIRSTYRWALRAQRAQADPTARLDRVIRRRTRDRVLSDAEVRDLVLGIDAAVSREADEKGPRLTAVQATAAKALLLLGQRLNETLRVRWQDLDLTARTWTIPAADRKTGKAHVVPLPPTVVKMLEDLRGAGKGESVFAGGRGRSIAHNPSRFAEAIREAAPTVEGWTPHDLRRTCASGCARLGASDEVVSRLLGHAVHGSRAGDATPIYQRYDRLAEVASALNAWSTHVARVVAGQEQQGADVLAMVRA